MPRANWSLIVGPHIKPKPQRENTFVAVAQMYTYTNSTPGRATKRNMLILALAESEKKTSLRL